MLKSNKMPHFAATATAIIFGFSFLFTKGALDKLDIFQLLGIRFLTAAIFLTLLNLFGAINIKVDVRMVKILMPVALLQPVIYFICETVGVGFTSASESGIVISLVPIAITVFAVIIIKEHLTLFQWVSIAVSVVGVIFIVLARESDLGGRHAIGLAALFGAVIAAGLYNVFSRKVSIEYRPIEITFVMMWVGAIIFNLVGISVFIADDRLNTYFTGIFDSSVIISLIYLGIISSVGAFFLLNYSLSKLEASKAGAFMNLTPVVTVLAGIFFRGEKLYIMQGLGAVLILAGIWGANYKTELPAKKVESGEII